MGESFGAYSIGHDAGLMRSITSANVAAGFHAGDPSVLRDTIRLAKTHGVAVGAHPGFPDLVGFGRRELNVTTKEAEDMVLYQIAAVAGVARAEGVTVQHVKPHGALFNMAVRNGELSAAIARAVAAFDKSLILFGLPGSRSLRPDAPLASAWPRKCLRIARTSRMGRSRRAVSRARSSTTRRKSSRAPSAWRRSAQSWRSTAPSCRSRPTRFASTATLQGPTIWRPRFAPASKRLACRFGPSGAVRRVRTTAAQWRREAACVGPLE